MARSLVSTIEHPALGRTSYRLQEADDSVRYRAVLLALVPAAAILLAAATVLSRLLIA